MRRSEIEASSATAIARKSLTKPTGSAWRSLGETSIAGYRVASRKH